jgi:serine/threonine-protein kinase RsbW
VNAIARAHGQEQTGRLALSLPPRPELLTVARLFAASVARHLRCSEETVEDIKVAISEAVTNAIKAHREAATDEPIEILAQVGPSLTYEVNDAGSGVAPEAMMQDDITPARGLVEGSFGLTLIRALFEDATLASNQRGGTTVRFSVTISGNGRRAS